MTELVAKRRDSRSGHRDYPSELATLLTAGDEATDALGWFDAANALP